MSSLKRNELLTYSLGSFVEIGEIELGMSKNRFY